MKKIFVIVFFFCCMKNVYGLENEEKKSLWYKIEEESKYFKLNENEKEYPLLDIQSFYKTDFTNWINVEPEKKEGREIEIRKIYTYQDMYPIHYLFLHNFLLDENELIIEKIEFLDVNNKNIDYKITCNNCLSPISHNEQEEIKVKKKSIVKIEFLNYEPTENLKIYIYMNEKEKNNGNFEVTATGTDNIKDIFYQKNYQIKPKNSHIYISIKNLEKINPRYKKEIRSENEVEKKYGRNIKKEKEYRFRDTFYRYYNVKKIYDKEYKKEGNSEYPYKEIEETSKRKTNFENKIIKLKNKYLKDNIFLEKILKWKKGKVDTKKEYTYNKKKITIFISFLIFIYMIGKYIMEKKKTCQPTK